MEKLYLVGTHDYDGTEGYNVPNVWEFPSSCFTSLEKAKLKYEELLEKAKNYRPLDSRPYIVEVDPESCIMKTIEGYNVVS